MKNIKSKMTTVSKAVKDKDYLSKEQDAVIRLILEKNPDGSYWALKWYESWNEPVLARLGKNYLLLEPKPGEVEKAMRRHLKYVAEVKAVKITRRKIASRRPK